MARSDTTTGQKIPILVYHHVYAEGSAELGAIEADNGAGVISEAAFRQQMAYLVDREWNVVSTSRVLDWIIDGTSLPPRAVVIHFDNGWLDTVTVALPILPHLDFCATCFPLGSRRRTAPGRMGNRGTHGNPLPDRRTARRGRRRKRDSGSRDLERPLREAPWIRTSPFRVSKRFTERFDGYDSFAILPFVASLALRLAYSLVLHQHRYIAARH